jgi:HJR/Mrr/RecB family endonuclease
MHAAALLLLVAWLIYRGIRLLIEAPARRRHEQRMKAVSVSGVDGMGGLEFEQYVLQVLKHRGFTGYLTSTSGDHGADIIATRNGTRYANRRTIGRQAVSEAVGAKAYYGCTGSMVITNSWFSHQARDHARATGTVLVDRESLGSWIGAFQVKG